MEDFTRHKVDFTDGFTDGYKRSQAGKFCRWKNHIDVTDGFHTINPIYTLSYEMGYIYHQEGKLLTDEIIDQIFIAIIKDIFSKHHDEFNL